MKLLTYISVSLVVFFVNCSQTTDVTGSGSSTETAIVHGFIYNSNNYPAINASVQLISVSHNPTSAEPILTSSTNAGGGYSFSSVPAGIYNLYAQNGSTQSLMDSIVIVKDTLLPSDTLSQPGVLVGTTHLSPPQPNGQILIIILGSNYYTSVSDSIGTFSIINLAKGTYNILFMSTLTGYSIIDTVIEVKQAQTTVFEDIIYLRNTPIPTISSFYYDTLKQITRVSWDRIDTNIVKGYVVYRRNVDSNTTFTKMLSSLITDTTFSDSFTCQEMTYEYKIAAYSKEDVESIKSSGIQIKSVSGYSLVRTIGGPGADESHFQYIQGIAVDSNGNVYASDYTGGYLPRIKKFDSSGNFLKSWTIETGVFEIAIYEDSLLYATSGQNIKVYDLNGLFKFQFQLDSNPGANAYSLCFFDTLLFSTDIYQQTVFKHSWQGEYLGKWVFPFNVNKATANIAVGSDSLLYFNLWDYTGNITTYDLSGNLNKAIKLIDNQSAICGIAISNSRHVYLTNYDQNKVCEYSISEGLISRWDVPIPSKIALNNNGEILISSDFSTKIQVYKRNIQ